MRAEFACRAVKWRVIFALMHWRWGMPQNPPAALCSSLKLEVFASAGAGLDLLFHAYGGWVCGQGKDQGCLLSLHLLPLFFCSLLHAVLPGSGSSAALRDRELPHPCNWKPLGPRTPAKLLWETNGLS